MVGLGIDSDHLENVGHREGHVLRNGARVVADVYRDACVMARDVEGIQISLAAVGWFSRPASRVC